VEQSQRDDTEDEKSASLPYTSQYALRTTHYVLNRQPLYKAKSTTPTTYFQRRIVSRLNLKRLLWPGLLIVITILAVPLMERTRQEWGNPPLPMDAWRGLTLDLWFIGLTVQRLALPLVLFFLLSSTSFFEHLAKSQMYPQDHRRLFGSLLGIQLLSLVYFSFTDNDPMADIFVVIIGALLGNRWTGLGMAALTFLAVSLQATLATIWPIAETFPEGISPLSLFSYIVDSVIDYAIAYPILWVGLAGVTLAEFLGKRRLYPWVAFLFGSVLAAGGALLLAILESWIIDLLLSGLLVTGAATAIVTLAVRSVQGQLAQRQAVEAELGLARAELRALRAQINPHFFFNALNTIRYFVRADPQTARGLLLSLSEIFQQALRAGEFIPLREEIDYIEAYLALEHARLDDRLQVRWNLPSADERGRLIPTLVLQPIVENAVIHGIAKQAEGGTITITITIQDQGLRVVVSDDGCGIEPERLATLLGPTDANDNSIGLRNIDSRLRILYGEDNGLTIESVYGQGVQVSFTIPIEQEARHKS
jgi:signal transduction histidine kinase